MITSIVTGCKVFIARPNEPEPRKAEILSIRNKKFSTARGAGGRKSVGSGVDELVEEEKLEYYVHYVEFNKVRQSFAFSTCVGEAKLNPLAFYKI